MPARRIPELAKQTIAEFQRLVKLQVTAFIERIKPQLKRKGRAAGMALGGLVLLRLAFLFLLAAATAGLAVALPVWAALLIMAGVLLLAGGLLTLLAVRGFKAKLDVAPAQAGEQIKQDIKWIRDHSE